jgi:predicted Zn-dependent protease
MSRRPDPCTKRTGDVLADLLTGHARAALDGPKAAKRYLDTALAESKSMPRAVAFFAWDLLAAACDELKAESDRADAVRKALHYLPAAATDQARALRDHLPRLRCLELGVELALDEGRFDDAVALCRQAEAMGLGDHFRERREGIEAWL